MLGNVNSMLSPKNPGRMKLMNPLAGQLNESIKAGNEHVYDMLSTLGKEIYFPKEAS